MRPTSVSVSSVAASAAVELPYQVSNTGLQLTFSAGTATATVQLTMDDIQNPPSVGIHWFAVTGLSAINSTDTVAFLSQQPVTAVRLNVTSFSSGPVVLRIVPGGYA